MDEVVQLDGAWLSEVKISGELSLQFMEDGILHRELDPSSQRLRARASVVGSVATSHATTVQIFCVHKRLQYNTSTKSLHYNTRLHHCDITIINTIVTLK